MNRYNFKVGDIVATQSDKRRLYDTVSDTYRLANYMGKITHIGNAFIDILSINTKHTLVLFIEDAVLVKKPYEQLEFDFMLE